jgi:hypothetical protein
MIRPASTTGILHVKNKFNLLVAVLIIVAAALLFPKRSAIFGDVPIEKYKNCDCAGIQVNTYNEMSVYTNYCFGIPHDCRDIFSCEGRDCRNNSKVCKCKETGYWVNAKVPCAGKDCICRNDECEKTALMGR